MKRVVPLLLGVLGLAALMAVVWSLGASEGPSPAPRPVPSPRFEVVEAAPTPSVEEPEAEGEPVWPADAPRSLQGQVTDAAGTPIVGAEVVVELRGGGVRRTRAGSEGRYQLPRLDPRIERLHVSAAGFEPHEQRRPTLPVEARVVLDFRLVALPMLRGRVVVAGGEAAAQARVVLRRPGERGWLGSGLTDEGGRFALAWPGDERLHLSAYHGQHGQARIDVDQAGDVLIELPGGVFVAGRVLDEAGAPVPSFSVTASPLAYMSGGPPAQSFEDPQGAFELGPLAAGEIKLWAAAEGYQPGEVAGLNLSPGERREGLVLRLRRSSILTGRVTDARTGRAVVGANVVPAEWNSSALAELVGAFTDQDGRYTLQALPGVRTSVRISADGYHSLLLGGVEGAPGAVTVRDFELTPAGGERPRGELTGIGAILMPHPEGVRLGQLVDGGPASEVLATGDVVLSVDGRSTRSLGMQRVAQAIRGEEGSAVVLQVRRGGRGPVEEVHLTRGRVAFPNRHHN